MAKRCPHCGSPVMATESEQPARIATTMRAAVKKIDVFFILSILSFLNFLKTDYPPPGTFLSSDF